MQGSWKRLIRGPYATTLASMALAAACITQGTWALFQDSENALDNSFASGRLDLGLTGAIQQGTLPVHTMISSGETVEGNVTLANVGTILDGDPQGHTVRLAISTFIEETDSMNETGAPSNNDETDIGSWLVVQGLTYGPYELAAAIPDANGNGWADLYDLSMTLFYNGPDPSPDGTKATVRIMLHPDTPRDVHRDELDLLFIFALYQV